MLAVYLSSLWLIFTAADRRSIVLDIPPAGADYMRADVRVVHVDLIRAEMTTRITLHPEGKLAQDRVTPATDFNLVLNTISGPQEFAFKKGQRINPIEAVFAVDGDPSLYPFDHYKGVLWLFATLPKQRRTSRLPVAQTPTSAVSNELAFSSGLPVSALALEQQTHADTRTTFWALIPGLTFRGSQSIQSGGALKGLTGIQVDLRRSPNVVLTSVITMLMMAGLSGGLVTMVLRVVSGSRPLKSFQVAMSTSLIFGLPALRNIQPGVPPPGTLGDSLVFAWAEMVAAASAVTLVVHWLLERRVGEDAIEPGRQAGDDAGQT